MTPAAQIAATIELLDEILDSTKPADGIVSSYFRKNRYIGSKDRRFIMSRLYRIMRHFFRLAWHINDVNGRSLVIAEMCMIKHEEPKEYFGIDKYAADKLTEDEITKINFLEKQRLHHRNMPEHIKLECPEWAVEPLQKHLGNKFSDVMKSMIDEAQTDIRTNSLKTDRKSLQAALLKEGIETKPTPYSPLGLRLEGGRKPLGNLEIFKQGHFEIQDEGSQLISLLAKPKAGMRVFDFCAGAGGKSIALGIAMQNKGSIMATDISEGRLKRAKERFRRSGLHNITTHKIESEKDKWLKRHHKKYDIVLVDSPCSGTGTWRRDPDKKWRDIGPKLQTLIELQKNIIKSAAKLVKNGGRLVYATCSMLPEENNVIFEDFINNNDEFSIVDLREENTLKNLPLASKYMELNPHENKTDGFFCAIAVRKENKNQEEE